MAGHLGEELDPRDHWQRHRRGLRSSEKREQHPKRSLGIGVGGLGLVWFGWPGCATEVVGAGMSFSFGKLGKKEEKKVAKVGVTGVFFQYVTFDGFLRLRVEELVFYLENWVGKHDQKAFGL